MKVLEAIFDGLKKKTNNLLRLSSNPKGLAHVNVWVRNGGAQCCLVYTFLGSFWSLGVDHGCSPF